MAQPQYSQESLIEFINLSNNGYAIEEYMHYAWKPVVAVAIAEGKVKRTAGVLHLPHITPFLVSRPQPVKQATPPTFCNVQYPNLEPDYEAAILARQARIWDL